MVACSMTSLPRLGKRERVCRKADALNSSSLIKENQTPGLVFNFF